MMRACLAAVLALLTLASGARAQTYPADVVERGRYLAVAGDCAACHTDPKSGAPFAGGYPIASPLGTIYATNITPSKAHGIGNYSEAQFTRALRQGVRADGARLYPAMPYTAYSQLSDADIHALFAYFRTAVAPVDRAAPTTRLPFPFNLRLSMAVWNTLFLKDHRFVPDPSRDAQWNRGAYLAGALEHCSTCHSPRGFLMQERSKGAYGGGAIGEWYAPNITSDPVGGIGGWSQAEIVSYLKTGQVDGRAQAAGGMAEAVTHSLSHLTQSDLEAIAAYVRTIAPVADPNAKRAAFSFGAPLRLEPGLRGARALWNADGAALYSGLCASCHGSTGSGTGDRAYPSLLNNSTVGAARPDNLVAVILNGVDRTVGGNHVLMPSFGEGSFVQPLSDQQIAAVATFVRQKFGPGDSVTQADVATARKGGPASLLLPMVRVGMAVAALIALALAIWLVRRRRGSGAGAL